MRGFSFSDGVSREREREREKERERESFDVVHFPESAAVRARRRRAVERAARIDVVIVG